MLASPIEEKQKDDGIFDVPLPAREDAAHRLDQGRT